jgi:hypothetical protein
VKVRPNTDLEMEKNSNSKEPKRGTIQSFFSSQTTKKKKCDASLISSELK